MISARTVSIILLSFWLIFFFILRKKTFTAKWYFYVLFIMSSAGIFLDLDKILYYITQSYSIHNIALFAVLLLLVLIPWLKYDKYLRNVRFLVNERHINLIKIICIGFIILSLFCIVYCLPYAISANAAGAEDIRSSGDGGLLPKSILTTIASGIATLAPVGILFFFICTLSSKISKIYQLGVLLTPIASVIHSMACQARELYVFLPLTFIILYLVFANSLPSSRKRGLRKLFVIGMVILLSYFTTITISRFGEFGSQSFISGTWGYIFQQPYVFDQTLQFFDNYKGFSKSLKFIGEMIGAYMPDTNLEFKTEYSFGTMYKAFYEMYGYSSLFIGALCYNIFFTICCLKSIKNQNAFTIMLNFTIFIWFTISGLFYFRYGMNDSQFILYILMLLLTPLYPRILNIKRQTNKIIYAKASSNKLNR